MPTTERPANALDEMFSDSEAEDRVDMNAQTDQGDSDMENDGEDEDIAPSSRRKLGVESHKNDDDEDMDEAEDEGLFGSDEEGDHNEAGGAPS
jgi:hypothetical protein